MWSCWPLGTDWSLWSDSAVCAGWSLWSFSAGWSLGSWCTVCARRPLRPCWTYWPRWSRWPFWTWQERLRFHCSLKRSQLSFERLNSIEQILEIAVDALCSQWFVHTKNQQARKHLRQCEKTSTSQDDSSYRDLDSSIQEAPPDTTPTVVTHYAGLGAQNRTVQHESGSITIQQRLLHPDSVTTKTTTRATPRDTEPSNALLSLHLTEGTY